ncbi:MAG: hypothetical protein E5299_00918 [Burkholderia gladioli]|nr:MAG: hypothetical protein E5299_00918 [Burkholderia gladioli]
MLTLDLCNNTPQQPMKLAYEQRPEEVQAWLLNETYPERFGLWKKPKALKFSGATKRGRARMMYEVAPRHPMGKAPERRVASRREGLSAMSTVAKHGQVR